MGNQEFARTMSQANMLAYSLGEYRDNEVDFYYTYIKPY